MGKKINILKIFIIICLFIIGNFGYSDQTPIGKATALFERNAMQSKQESEQNQGQLMNMGFILPQAFEGVYGIGSKVFATEDTPRTEEQSKAEEKFYEKSKEEQAEALKDPRTVHSFSQNMFKRPENHWFGDAKSSVPPAPSSLNMEAGESNLSTGKFIVKNPWGRERAATHWSQSVFQDQGPVSPGMLKKGGATRFLPPNANDNEVAAFRNHPDFQNVDEHTSMGINASRNGFGVYQNRTADPLVEGMSPAVGQTLNHKYTTYLQGDRPFDFEKDTQGPELEMAQMPRGEVPIFEI